MIVLLLFLLLNKVCSYSNELILSSTRLRVRPVENAYAFGILDNEKIDYFNCTIGDLQIYEHNYTTNWVWKYKVKYETKNFTTYISISKNNILYTKKLDVYILDYTPRIMVDKNIIQADDTIIINTGAFIGGNITVNIGTITSYYTTDYTNKYIKSWHWIGQTKDLFKTQNYVVITICVDENISTEFFIYQTELLFSKIYYQIYIPNYSIEKEFIDTVIVKIATSHVFNIDESKISLKESQNDISTYQVYKITIDFVSVDKAKSIKDNILTYVKNGFYFEKIINNARTGENMFLFEPPIIENIYMTNQPFNNIRLYVILSLMILIFILTQCYSYFLIKTLTNELDNIKINN